MSEITQIIGGTLQLGDRSYDWKCWDGETMRQHIAIDTETTMIEGHKIPQLAMISVSDGVQHFVLRPEQLSRFLMQHLPCECELIAHNLAFDFWVLDHYLAELAEAGSQDARSWLWSTVEANRCHDTMLLAGLINLAQRDDDGLPSLEVAVRDYCGINLEKDTYRTRYAETIGQDWGRLDPGFFQYVIADAIACYQLYCHLTPIAEEIISRAGCSRQYGLLTEFVQVKGAIALAAIERTGMRIDLQRAKKLGDEIQAKIEDDIAKLEEMAGHDVWRRYKRTGERRVNKESGLPLMNTIVLAEQLDCAARTAGIEPPLTKSGKITMSVKEFWNQHRTIDPLVEFYCDYTELTKLRTFVTNLNEPVIHPRYRVFVRTGRTSCSRPNVQQLPRNHGVREVIVARPDHLLFLIDYSAVELVALAAVCQQRYGYSQLGDVLRAGVDPHNYTAAMFAGVEIEEFQLLPECKQLRQQAKAINFGFPGGLGVKTLVTYAKQSYGITISEEQAGEFRTKLIEQVYPELKLYLSEDSAPILAATLRADVQLVRATFPEGSDYGVLKKVTEGRPFRSDGAPYEEGTVERVWQKLQWLNKNPELSASIANRDTTETSPLRRLMYTPVMTPTGRLRGQVSYTAARNAPFQGLAADGAKLAMWDLLKTGYRVVAFVHDEFIIELPRQSDIDAKATQIKSICCEAMQQLVGDIPVRCEYALAERWYKQAEAVYDQDGNLQPYEPTSQQINEGTNDNS